MRKFKNRNLPRGIMIQRGYVWIRFFPHGRRVVKLIGPANMPGSLDKAISLLSEYREQLRVGAFGRDSKAARITVREAIDIFMDVHGKKTANQGRNYRTYFKKIDKMFGHRFVDEITYKDIEDLRHQVESEGSCLSTVNRYHTTMTCFFNKLRFAKRKKVIKNILLPEDNPATLVKKNSEAERVRNRLLTTDEYNRFIKVMAHDPELIRIFQGALVTLLRRKDLKFLSKGNIHENSNRLKGYQAKTKLPYSIHITSDIRELINTAPTGDKIFDFTNFRKRWDSALKLVGLQEFQFRDLRRTGATLLHNKGMKLKAISKYLGHATMAMTERYIGVESDDAVVAGQTMETIIAGMRKQGEDESSKILEEGLKNDVDLPEEENQIDSQQTRIIPSSGQAL
ncbi:MAG: tyrosine-type recombinase/integrase [Elusimicrobiota bacterium]